MFIIGTVAGGECDLPNGNWRLLRKAITLITLPLLLPRSINLSNWGLRSSFDSPKTNGNRVRTQSTPTLRGSKEKAGCARWVVVCLLACTSRCTSCRSYNSPCVRSCSQARQKDGDRGLVDNERDSAPPVQFLSREPLPRLSGEESGMLCSTRSSSFFFSSVPHHCHSSINDRGLV